MATTTSVRGTDTRTYRLGFALEYSLGHVTHAENLKQTLAADASVHAECVDLPYHNTPVGAWGKMPGIRSNWSLRASLGAYLAFRRMASPPQAALFHTQVTSLFSEGFMRRVPSAISLDATPAQIDTMGVHYGHAPGSISSAEKVKNQWNRRALHAARKIITWSQWTKDSVAAEYGVSPDRIVVIPPGIPLDAWDFAAQRETQSRERNRTVRVLFVGGDFKRKGGDILLKAMLSLPANVHLDLVTQTADLGPEGEALEARGAMTVHRGLGPNNPKLRQLFAEADIFAFPTRADCLPLAILEALASGLPVVASSVGAIPEAVINGRNGRIVPPDDAPSFAAALRELTEDASLRGQFGREARRTAEERFDARVNYHRTVNVLKELACA